MDISEKYPYVKVDFRGNLGIGHEINAGNMSLCSFGDRFLVSIRQFNYKIDLNRKDPYVWPCGFYPKRNNHFAIVDSDFNFEKSVKCSFIGLELAEDIRVMNFGSDRPEIQASFTYPYEHIRMGAAWMDMDNEKGELFVKQSFRFPFEWNKNWIPTLERGKFISDIQDGFIKFVSMDDPYNKETVKCRWAIPCRGSSQLHEYEDGFVALVHRRDVHTFTNALAFFERDFSSMKIGECSKEERLLTFAAACQ